MSDWDREDDELGGHDAFDTPARPPAEGVRIIGAEEAAAALEAGQAAGRRPDDAPRFGDVPAPPPEGPRPAVRFPLPDSVDPSEAAPRPMVSPPTAMPHWTEPATGEIPKVLAGDDPPPSDDDDLSAWAALGRQPRWRDEHSGWDDFDDASVLADDQTRTGALDSARSEHSDLYDFDTEQPVAAAYDPPDEPLVRTRSGAVTRRVPQQPSYPPIDEVAPAGAAGGGRDVNAAVITGAGVGFLALFLFFLGPGWAMLLVTAVVTMAAVELFDVLRRSGYQPATLLGLAATLSVMYAAYEKGETALPLVLVLTTLFSFAWYLFGVVRARPTVNVAATVFGFVWVGFLGSYAALMLNAGGEGLIVLLTVILATVAADVGAYAVGSQIGRRPLAADISPNKTIEGMLGGVLVSVVVTMLFMGYLPGTELWTEILNRGDLFIFAIVIALVAPIGDLAESLIKRDLGIKDTGSILPGHGGLLDRFDAMLFTLPAAYYLLKVIA